jgi:hypothetical protein
MSFTGNNYKDFLGKTPDFGALGRAVSMADGLTKRAKTEADAYEEVSRNLTDANMIMGTAGQNAQNEYNNIMGAGQGFNDLLGATQAIAGIGFQNDLFGSPSKQYNYDYFDKGVSGNPFTDLSPMKFPTFN